MKEVIPYRRNVTGKVIKKITLMENFIAIEIGGGKIALYKCIDDYGDLTMVQVDTDFISKMPNLYKVKIGLMSQKEYDDWLTEKQITTAQNNLKYEKELYQRLKLKFEGEKVK